jgi:excisionase family DNA binding protein
VTTRAAPNGTRKRPAETSSEQQAVPITSGPHKSWLYGFHSGPFHGSLSIPTPHPSPDSDVARKAATVPLKALYRVSEAMSLLSMSRTVIYEQIRAGRLRSVKQGRARLIPYTAITDYVALLERESSMGRAA